MNNIKSAKYTSEDLNWVQLTFDDGSTANTSVLDGIRRQYTDMFDAWIKLRGVVAPQYTQAELDAQALQEADDALRAEFKAEKQAQEEAEFTTWKEKKEVEV